MSKLLGNHPKGGLFIVSAPAGTGKSTLVRMLCDEFACVVESCSCTTRAPRPSEREGRDYHFVTQEAFDAKIAEGAFLEHVRLFGASYGTLREEVERHQNEGKHVVLVIDVQGARQLREKITATFIFIKPPHMEALHHRLSQRQTESSERIAERLAWAGSELATMGEYDYCIVNDDMQTSYQALRSILIAEEHLIRSRDGTTRFID